MKGHRSDVDNGGRSASPPSKAGPGSEHRRPESSQLKAVSRVAAALSGLSDLQAVLRVGLESVCDLLGATWGGIFLLDEESAQLTLRLARHLAAEGAGARALAVGEGVASRVVETGRALFIEDIASDGIVAQGEPSAGELSGLGGGFLAGIPLCSRHKVLGVLEAGGSESRSFSSDDRYALVCIGDLLGVAIDRAEVLEQLSRGRETYQRLARYCLVAQDEERRRIARELHDETSQSISALALNLRALVEVAEMSGLSPEMVERLKKVETLAQGTGYELTRIINDLRPGLLDSAGLVAAIRRFAHDHLEAQDVKVEVEVKGSFPRLASEIEANLFRFAQGAITNIARHAEAHSVSITLECSPEKLVMRIRDDGRGFAISEITGIDEKTGRGRGLFAMKERIRLLGGSCAVTSAPGEGTTVRAEIPLGRSLGVLGETRDVQDSGLGSR